MNIATEIYTNGDVEIVVKGKETDIVFEISYINAVQTVRVVADGAKVRVLRAESVATDMSVDRL